ncbi:hypothetical protein [uncultured Amnibacterium sp.]|uniref:hypothetical protein n=1 Tax=uncultured Amnibacterium sp. TaxID=1631851 RepID=UPI0035CBF12F
MADDTTPSDLERELGIDQRRIRHHLRQRYGNLPGYTDNWHLNARAAEEVRLYFRAEAEALRASGESVPTARLRRSETGSLPVLFNDAIGSTTYDAQGNLVYLPSPAELQQRPAGE